MDVPLLPASDLPPELAILAGQAMEFPMEIARPQPVVYFLIRCNRVVYVGQSVQLCGRLLAHFPNKDFDRIVFVPVEVENEYDTSLNNIELGFIRKLRPEYNRSHLDGRTDDPYRIDIEPWFDGRRHEEKLRLAAVWEEERRRSQEAIDRYEERKAQKEGRWWEWRREREARLARSAEGA